MLLLSVVNTFTCFRIRAYVVRKQQDIKHVEYFTIMKPQLDQAMKWQFEEMSDSGIRMMLFLQTNLEALSLLMGKGHLEKILVAGEKNCDGVCTELHDCVNGSAAGRAMFGKLNVKSARSFFRKRIVDGITDLIDLKFLESEVANFRKIMARRVTELVGMGHKRFELVQTNVQFFGELIQVTLETPDDEVEYRIAAIIKSCAINSGQLAMLPWEEALFKTGEMSKVPMHLKVAEPLLFKYKMARQAMLDYLDQDDAHGSIQDMIVSVVGKTMQLQKIDRTVVCDVAFLETRGLALLREQIQQAVLQALPSEEKCEVDIDAVLETLSALKASRKVAVSNSSIQSDVTCVHGVVSDLKRKYAGAHRQEDKHSAFFTLALKRCEWFYSVKYDEPCTACKDGQFVKGAQRKTLRGGAALRFLFDHVKSNVTDKGTDPIDMEDMRPLKLYSWAFSKDESQEITRWCGSLANDMVKHREALEAGGATDDTVHGKSKQEIVLMAEGAASSSRDAAAVPKVDLAPAKKAVAADKKSANLAGMMEFFQPRSTS